MFDETYYVKDAYTLSQLGYEGSWPADANLAFNAGQPADLPRGARRSSRTRRSANGSSPLGLAIFGADDPFGWRIAVAVCGILLVLLTMFVAKRLFRSTLLTVIAGGLLAIDGNAIVMSRVALLDTMLALFVLVGAAACCSTGSPGGPPAGARPWLLIAGLAFGVASGVKWSGLYFLAAFAVYALGSEVIARDRAGHAVDLGTIARQGPATFLLMVPVALVVYVVSWAAGSRTQGGYYRHWIENEGGEAWTGLLSWVPYDFQNWWHYQASMYAYHLGEHTPHNYQANPLTWLFLQRPTSMYWHANGNNAETILGLANPLIWWAGTAALIYLTVRLVHALVLRIRGRGPLDAAVSRDAFIMVGFAAGYLPWLLYLGRTVFQFYTIAFEPFLVLALTAAIATLLGSPADPERRRVIGLRVVGVFLVACVLLSLFFLPIWTGMEIPRWYLNLHFWFPSWI